jgi:uncharacterized phage protein gp47/JayE
MSFGLTEEGFNPKTLDDAKTGLEESFQSEFGTGVPLHPESRNGQTIGIMSERFAELWAALEDVYSSQDADQALDDALDRLCALTGTIRKDPTQSTVTGLLAGTTGTLVETGKVASVEGTGKRFGTLEDATLVEATAWLVATSYAAGDARKANGNVYLCTQTGVSAGAGAGPTGTGTAIVDGTCTWRFVGTGTGKAEVPMQSEEFGPIVANAYSLTSIETAVSGWTGIVNPLDADLGSNKESNPDLRLRRETELRRAGNAAINAIRADVLDVEDVDEVKVFENVTMTTDGDGLPPKSIEVVVLGGDDQDLRDAILGTKAGGIETHGSVTGTATDEEGISHTIKFSRPTEKPVYIDVDVVTDPEKFPSDGDEQIKQALINFSVGLLEELGDGYQMGDDVITSQLYGPVFSISGVVDVTSIKISFAPGPSSSANLVIAAREIATLETVNIDVDVS